MIKRNEKNPGELLVKWLARCDLSCAEARSKLLSQGVSPVEIDETISLALSRRFLDDRRLAENLLAKALSRLPPAGRTWIESRLDQRGIPRDIWEPLVGSAWNPEEASLRLREYVRTCSSRVAPATLFSRLTRAGHSPEEVREVFSHLGMYPEES